MLTRSMRRGAAALSLMLALPAALRAQGPILSNASAPRGTRALNLSTQQYIAVGMTLSATAGYRFTSLVAPLLNLASTPQTIFGAIYSDAAGLPGVALQSFGSQPIAASQPVTTFTFTTTAPFTMTGGNTYWFVLWSDFASSSPNAPSWFQTQTNVSPTAAPDVTFAGRAFTTNGDGTWSTFTNPLATTPQFTINAVSTVPEPGTYALMVAGLAGLAVVARRRARRA